MIKDNGVKDKEKLPVVELFGKKFYKSVSPNGRVELFEVQDDEEE